MNCYICGAQVYTKNGFEKINLFIKNGIVAEIFSEAPTIGDAIVFYVNNCFVFPGLIDVHVHLREPGFFYKESMLTGTLAAAKGGFTSICSMPNLNPVPDCLDSLKIQQEIIARDAKVRVYPYGSITVGEKQQELSNMDEIACQVIAFTDDGVGVATEQMMEAAMLKAKPLGKMIVAHCEDMALTAGGFIHDGKYARANGFVGNPSESEWKQIERDLALVEKTGCKYHVCHISAKESVQLIREAKKRGLDVSCETAPHYLVLCDEDLSDEGRFRMNPPIRSKEDRAALIEGIKDGTVDMVATDHAPHSNEEKSGNLASSLNGIVGLETAFQVLYTNLVLSGEITLEMLIKLMHTNPSRRFGIGSPIKLGAPADLTVFNLDEKETINPDSFISKGRATPFAGNEVYGKHLLTLVDGVPVVCDKTLCFNKEVKI